MHVPLPPGRPSPNKSLSLSLSLSLSHLALIFALLISLETRLTPHKRAHRLFRLAPSEPLRETRLHNAAGQQGSKTHRHARKELKLVRHEGVAARDADALPAELSPAPRADLIPAGLAPPGVRAHACALGACVDAPARVAAPRAWIGLGGR